MLTALAALIFLAWYIPDDRSQFMVLFRNFHMELPTATKLVFSIPAEAFWVTAGTLAILVVAVQMLAHSNASAALFHMFLIVLCGLAFSAYREVISQAMLTLIHGL